MEKKIYNLLRYGSDMMKISLSSRGFKSRRSMMWSNLLGDLPQCNAFRGEEQLTE